MATTFVDYTGDGNATKSFSFPSIKEADIKVDVDGVIKTASTHYNITSYTTTGGGNVVFIDNSGSGGTNHIPASPAAIRIFRDTDVDSAKATFTAGSSVKAGDLNNNMTQILYAAQEEQNQTILTSDIKDAAVTTAKIQADAVTGAKIADDQINSEHYVDGSIDTAHIADSQITSAKIVDGTIVAGDLASNAITTVKITDSNVTTAKIADSNVTTAKIADANVTTAKIADANVTHVKLAADCVDGSNIQDSVINTEHYADGSIRTEHVAAGEINTSNIAATAVTTAKIAADAVTNAKIADDSIDSEHYVDGSIDTAHIAGAQVTDAKLASNSVITSKITDANVTTVKIADSNVTLAKLASDLKQTSISNSDTQLPTSGAVVDYVAAQIAPLGGLEVIATEVAFPNTQPQAGVVISISDAQGVVVSGSGSSTTGRTVGGSTVTINNFPSSLNSETLAAGVGLMVSSTGSSQTYNYHKLLAAETDVKQLSDDINDFNERYRVGSSNPTSALDGGDLFFNTGSGKLLVYNNTQSAWEEAQSIGQYFINTISSYSGTGGNNATFNGSAYRFVLSNPGAVAEQHIVSVNGVIQKPNSGTSQPSEGFAIDGSSIIFSSAPPSSADFFIITIGSTVNIGTPSNGTVSTDKLASGAVTTAKLADANVTTAKIADDAVTAAKLANSINSEITANTAKTSNATHTGEVTGGTALTIADNVVDEANLKVSNSPTNGYLLSAQSGNTGGLTWVVAPSSDLVDDTSPQLGGDLDTNSFEIKFDDDHNAVFGNDDDLKIKHSGSNGNINNYTGDLVIRTLNSGDDIFIDSNDDVSIRTHATDNAIKCIGDGAVELYYDASKKFETTSTGATVTGKLDFTGSGHLNGVNLGASQQLNLYHDASDAYFDNNTGDFYIRNDGNSTSEQIKIQAKGGESSIIAKPNGSVELYYDNSKKFETRSDGNKSTGIFYSDGNLLPWGNNTSDLGSTSNRWANLYTNDLHLSNVGHTNDVDGTWGDWTIQEGESDLFLKNNRSGKKYKFNLTEVS